MRPFLLVVVAAALLSAPLALPVASADPPCEPDYPCDPDPSQIDCFQPVKGTLNCAVRIATGLLP